MNKYSNNQLKNDKNSCKILWIDIISKWIPSEGFFSSFLQRIIFANVSEEAIAYTKQHDSKQISVFFSYLVTNYFSPSFCFGKVNL